MNSSNSNFIKAGDSWRSEFLLALQMNAIIYNSIDGNLISFPKHSFIIHLVNSTNNFLPEDLIQIQNQHSRNNVKLIHLWEDVWLVKSKQVIYRIKSLLGLNIRIHGRKTEVRKLNKPEADKFINEFHLQGAVSSRHKFGLYYNNELFAVATFSALRKMNHTDNYKSIELIRFAIKGGFSISGGLSKLIKHVKIALKPNDIMTYADRDWSAGDSYLKIVFEKVGILDPQFFSIDENLNRQLQKNETPINSTKVFNTGSIKFILKF
ncbi:hypothetical protein [Pedobacter jejuensis]|uniref:Uncharacterized protein n=1 Tax=Pedobacter jejuensis TaxID=1268550 RepID=A0A3N0BTM9_9SPHI|nr:hypothetical protein [Pedobacter jejuensis]RNL52240.1 hypothetical protein D7004_11760 [Pedobacter jejuensis]